MIQDSPKDVLHQKRIRERTNKSMEILEDHLCPFGQLYSSVIFLESGLGREFWRSMNIEDFIKYSLEGIESRLNKASTFEERKDILRDAKSFYMRQYQQ